LPLSQGEKFNGSTNKRLKMQKKLKKFAVLQQSKNKKDFFSFWGAQNESNKCLFLYV